MVCIEMTSLMHTASTVSERWNCVQLRVQTNDVARRCCQLSLSVGGVPPWHSAAVPRRGCTVKLARRAGQTNQALHAERRQAVAMATPTATDRMPANECVSSCIPTPGTSITVSAPQPISNGLGFAATPRCAGWVRGAHPAGAVGS